MPLYDPNSIPDDPYRVAPPYCAPGEKEPREPTQHEIWEMRKDVETEIFNSLKYGHDFTYYTGTGYWEEWSFDDLWDVLINELGRQEIAQTMAALMDNANNVQELNFVNDVRNSVRAKAIEPFVEQQAQLRLDSKIALEELETPEWTWEE